MWWDLSAEVGPTSAEMNSGEVWKSKKVQLVKPAVPPVVWLQDYEFLNTTSLITSDAIPVAMIGF